MATQTQTEQPRQTKTAFVRDVLKEIGAITPNPPEGWRQKVEEALEKQKLEMHTVTIYQIRQKALKDAQANGGKSKGKKGATGGTKVAVTPPAEANGTPKAVESKLSVGDLQAVQEFSKRFGGLDGLNDALKVLQGFRG